MNPDKLTMKQIPAMERPYEKCLRCGAESLSDVELLAVILRTGSRKSSALDVAAKVLSSARSGDGLLSLVHLSVSDLMEIDGIGQVKAVQIRSIVELGRRIASASAREKISFRDPESIARYYMESLRYEEQENVVCMMLDTKNHLLGDVLLTKGTVNASLLSPREIFVTALSWRAVHIILVHNHPSGDCSPSRNDIEITRQIYSAGELIGIQLLDHIIVGSGCYTSLRQEGLFGLPGEARG